MTITPLDYTEEEYKAALPPLVAYEDDVATNACQEAAAAHAVTWTDCDRGSFHCPSCPLAILSSDWSDGLERKG